MGANDFEKRLKQLDKEYPRKKSSMSRDSFGSVMTLSG